MKATQNQIAALPSRIRALRVAAPALAVLVMACRDKAPPPPTVQGVLESPSATVSPTGVHAPLAQLVDSLERLPGTFEPSIARWSFVGEDGLFNAIAEHGDSAVVALVACLDRADSATATVQGRRTLVGAMCFLALHRMAYATAHEDASGTWAGVVQPTATPEELIAAKNEWLRVVREKRYRIA